MEIGFIGLGKLGLECSEVIAEHHTVCGYDIDDIKTRNVIRVDTIEKTIVGKDFTFIAVPTPHSENYDGRYPTTNLPPKDFDYSIVKDVLKDIKDIKSDSTIVLISTVLPGTIRRELIQHVDPTRFIYNPYLIAMGTIVEDMKHPEMIIMGCQETDPTELKEFYQKMSPEARIEIGTFDEAESIKIFYNTFISMKISFVNMILDVAERNGNINTDVVTAALSKSTKRIISDMYMKAGMGDGGPCHPRDNIALSSLSENLDLGYDFFGQIMKIRERQAENLANELIAHNNPIVILGASYKPEVELKEGSYSILISHYIKRNSHLEVYFDEEPETQEQLTYLIGHMKEFNNYDFKDGSVVVDPWGECPEVDGYELVTYGRR